MPSNDDDRALRSNPNWPPYPPIGLPNRRDYLPQSIDYERIRTIVREEIIAALRVPREYWDVLDANTLFVPPGVRKDGDK